MLETYYAGAYWGARQETAVECAQRAGRFFAELAQCDSSFSHWYRAGKGHRGQPGKPVDTQDLAALEAVFIRGRNRTDFGKQVIPEIGFNLLVWNEPSQATHLDITCGGYSWGGHNLCLAELPSEGPAAERLLSAPVLERMLQAMALAWEPDWGVATSETLRDEVLKTSETGTFVGWINYFSRHRGTVPPLPAPVRIEPVGTLGTLVILTPERFTAHNPEHVTLARRVQELLSRAGLLGPLQQGA